ncbi:hypothetical protein CYY_000184 [Polysphondylium violaceum]|uniref:Glutathione S-transferase n=1 Tax=Polysphondylium violaceum TaxID=133409 RepID=A0A8J4Q2E7_9MYCE|nr:hypothetical protein CYY_000184 [Polysphondylium violaceum]
MSCKLYHCPFFASSFIAQFIVDLKIQDQVEIVLFGYDKMKNDFHYEKHPQGRIPFYTEGDDFSLIESSAILLHLLDKFDTDKKLSNWVDGKQKARFYELLLFHPTTIYPAVQQVFAQTLFQPGHPAYNPQVTETNTKIWNEEIVPHLSKHLGSQKFFFGDEYSVADIILSYPLVLANDLGLLTPQHKALYDYYSRISQRPSFQEIYSEANREYLPTLEKYNESWVRKAERDKKLAELKIQKEQQQQEN